MRPCRITSLWLCALVAALALLVTARPAGAATAWSQEPPPSWRVARPFESPPSVADPSTTTGIRTLLFDRQERIGQTSDDTYTHVVEAIVNEAGLEAASSIEVGFDASFQKLVLHSAVVHRDGRTFDRLASSVVRMAQREARLDEQIFDARLSAVVFLSDLRVGDVVEYEYTLRGADPTLRGRYVGEVQLGGKAPIDHLVQRVVVPSNRPITVAAQGPDTGSAATPTQLHAGATTEYVWDLRNVPAFDAEDGAPSWYDGYPWAELSEFASWGDVAKWGADLFHVELPKKGALYDWVAATRKQSTSIEDFTLRAIRFVQDEVRYVAIEVGMGRRRPTDPTVVFERRYGDCKDKTSLLVAILRMEGVDATPALVSSTHGHTLQSGIATPDVFDHAIARIQGANGKTYWADSTLSLQGGGLDRLVKGPFEYALPLDHDTTSLQIVEAVRNETASPYIRDTFVAPLPGAADEAQFESERVYEGDVADSMRAAFLSQTLAQTTKYFLSLYAEDFPGIHEVAPLERIDDRGRNVVRVKLHFSIPSFWWKDEKGEHFRREMVARPIDRILPMKPATARTAPIALAYPMRARYVVEMDLPFDLPVSPGDVFASTPELEFEFDEKLTKRHLSYDYEYATHASSISAAQYATSRADLDRARASLDRVITYRVPFPDGVNGWGVVALLSCVPFFAWGAVRIYRQAPPVASTEGREDRAPRPIGGWTAFLGFVLSLNLVRYAIACVQTARVALSSAEWHARTTPGLETYQPSLAAVLFIEAACQLALIAYLSVVLALYFRHRSTFPKHVVRFLAIGQIFTIVDQVAVANLVPDRDTTIAIAGIVASVCGVALWISYVRLSRRVAETFVR